MNRRFFAPSLAFVLVLAALISVATPARAQSIIKQPGNHTPYGLELDPHLLAEYGNTPYADGGFGLGLRFSIPFVHNGPVPQINNNIGISFGIDWAHFGSDGRCNGADSCSADELWFPVTGQWNFFLTKIISVFGEFGLAANYTHWSSEGPCGNGGTCNYGSSHVDLFEPVAWAGGRFLFGRNAGLTVRLGWPYISVGASILF
jgi:hypothetical protein